MKTLLMLMMSLAVTLGLTVPKPAHALFGGLGGIVLDPSNLAQNVLTATRTLQMVNNQIRQLTNEAQMLTHQARNLQNLDFNTLSRLRSTLATVQRLFDEAEGLSFQLAHMQSEFARLYPRAYAEAVNRDQLRTDRHEQWAYAREAVGTAMQVQSQATQNFAEDEAVLVDLVSRSQSAEGALQAAQATNQLLALQTRQLMQAQQLQIAQERAAALEQARILAAEERSRQLRRQFMRSDTRYTPESVALFR
jgi:P-type conjugative transfer protein TrbJ